MLDIKPLRYFITLAETRHFGRAAARLNLSQPPLSRQLVALEASLGVRLVERNSRSVTLTAAGERFYADAQAILAAVRQAEENARAVAHGEAGTLAVGFTMCAAYSVVPGYAKAFAATYPAVELSLREIVSNDLAGQVLSGRVDAAIMFPRVVNAGLAARTVVREPLCVALPRSHPRARQHKLKIAQLARDAFVMASDDVAPYLHATIVEHCRRGGFAPDVRLEVRLQQTVLSLVDEAVGVALVPASMSRIHFGNVVFRPLVDAPTIELMLAWLPGNRNPCLERFLDLAQEA
ncbi:MAG TPA: LysR family transcriptional regulator [Burkholderiaceae bacterium]|nr:LysR family transcriptional regulator [Burkholderiaceae bacterium]